MGLLSQPTAPRSPAKNQSSPPHAVEPPPPAAYAPPHYSDTTAESPATPPPESAAPRHNPSSSPPDPPKPPRPPAKHLPEHSSTAPDYLLSAESSPTHTHSERCPDLHYSQSTAAHRSETRPWSRPHKTSQTPPIESPRQSPRPATAVATPQPSAGSSHPYSSSWSTAASPHLCRQGSPPLPVVLAPEPHHADTAPAPHP